MDVMDALSLVGGLALFLFGMSVMGDSMKKSAGNRLKTVLSNWTSNPFKGFSLGLGATAVVQSSSATTVMVVGFVNSGAMLLAQAVFVIMGANLGSAVTSWLTALNGIQGGSEALSWLNWLKPSAWVPILAVAGAGLVMFGKRSRHRDVGAVLMGFAVLMTGMDIMGDAVSDLKGAPFFTRMVTFFENPIPGVLVGTFMAAAVQSSAASIGIMQALSVTGVISYSAAIPIILGQSIGTCITALLSSVSANRNGKRAAMVHLYFNLISVTAWLCLYYLIGWILKATGAFDLFAAARGTTIDMWGIAGVHTLFKLLAVLLMAPFAKWLARLSEITVRGSDRKRDEVTDLLDERLIGTPAVAMERAREVACRMMQVSARALRNAAGLVFDYDARKAQAVRDDEELGDLYEDALGSYLVRLSSTSMLEKDSMEGTKLLRMIGDLERISDHAVNIVESAEELRDKRLSFSDAAVEELSVILRAVSDIVTMTEESFLEDSVGKAACIEPLEQVVDSLKRQIRMQHTERLQKGTCTIEQGFILSDILTDLERVSDHCSNIAGYLIEMSRHSAMNVHDYLHRVKEGSAAFDDLYRQYTERYTLPGPPAP